MMARVIAYSALLAAALSGCGAASDEELQQWMTEQRAQMRPKVQPIPEPKKFTPQVYTQEAAVEPFSNTKLSQALGREAAQPGTSSATLVTPELARRKEALESFPLDTMSMVGTMVRGSQTVALVKVANLLYQMRPGNYLGQNYGRITKVTETEVLLREIVQDSAGEWIERNTTLQLQERPK